MKYATGTDFRRALEACLCALSQRDEVPLARLRKFVAFDRLLARFLHTEVSSQYPGKPGYTGTIYRARTLIIEVIRRIYRK